MNQMPENDLLYKWKPKENDSNKFTPSSVKKCRSQGVEFEMKEKYEQISLERFTQ